MNLVLDVFNSKPFGAVSLTNAIIKMPFVSTQFGNKGYVGLQWSEDTSLTTSVAVDIESHQVYLLDSVERGSPLPNAAPIDRSMISVGIPRFGERFNVRLDELLGVRDTGGVNLMAIETLRDKKAQAVKNRLVHTDNYQKVRALDGLVVSPVSGTVLTNFHTLFATGGQTVIQVDMTSNPNFNALLGVWKRKIEDKFGAYQTTITGYILACGRWFYRCLMQQAQVIAAWTDYSAKTAQLRFLQADRDIPGGFTLADNVRVVDAGQSRLPDGSNGFIDDWTAYLLLDAPGFLRTVYGPSSWLRFLGQPGSVYALPSVLPDESGIALDVESFPINFAERPDLILKIQMIKAQAYGQAAGYFGAGT
jgi:hypothetical protein